MTSTSTIETALSVTKRIPPLWPLDSFVAVNPFVGMVDQSFASTALTLERNLHDDILMPIAWYHEQWKGQAFTRAHLDAAAQHSDLSSSEVIELITSDKEEQFTRLLSVTDWIDETSRHGLARFVLDEISKWCSVYFDQGQSSWPFPWKSLPLFQAWKEASAIDLNMESFGYRNFRKSVASLPDTPLSTIEKGLHELQIPTHIQADYLHRLLLSIHGWASHLQYQGQKSGKKGSDQDPLLDLLAIRLSYDVFLWRSLSLDQQSEWRTAIKESQQANHSKLWRAKMLAHSALEIAFQQQLFSEFKFETVTVPERPETQGVFCIDVRSERLRRHLESQSSKIQTIGFAGFFGLPIQKLSIDGDSPVELCPVLLKPSISIKEGFDDSHQEALIRDKVLSRQKWSFGWAGFKTAAVSCFSFIECLGIWNAITLVRKTTQKKPSQEGCGCGSCHPRPMVELSTDHQTGIAQEQQTDLAYQILKNLGLTSNFARLVLLCGHGSASTNNPYAASLDCGACGGHAGDFNARVLTSILNSTHVRRHLQAKDILIPDDTWFVAGLHNTTTDTVSILDVDQIPTSHQNDYQKLQRVLEQASRSTRAERAVSLKLNPNADPLEATNERAADWSQVRPEWGLAGNAGFIAAPRWMTSGLNLQGRVFLHDYDPESDAEGNRLELILTAPVVVASWINLQYFGSTVAPLHLSSGNKVLHNMVGSLGVWQGNGGDLQVGLPLQSLHDGEKWVHEPLRLHVVVAAPQERIDRILAKHEHVRHLVENQWLHLFSVDLKNGAITQRIGGGTWK